MAVFCIFELVFYFLYHYFVSNFLLYFTLCMIKLSNQYHPWIRIISPNLKERREENLEMKIKIHKKQIKKIEDRLNMEKEISEAFERELRRMRYTKLEIKDDPEQNPSTNDRTQDDDIYNVEGM